MRKGIVVSALVFCSLATVRTGIRLPTRAGALLSTIFVYFDILFQQRHNLHRKHLLRDIDRILYQLSATTVATDQQEKQNNSTKNASPPRPHYYNHAVWLREVALALLFFAFHFISVIITRTVL